ncbi:MAG: NAD-glutamate dehydrogenase [Pseudohongiellaceae bacterium]
MLPLNQKIDDAFPRSQVESVKVFAHKYFASSANSELAKCSDDELFELVEQAWEFIHVRRSSAPKIHFQHTSNERDDGSPRRLTRVYVLLDDMPFVVDSTRQCLNRMGAVIRHLNNTVIHVKRARRTKRRGGDLRELSAHAREGFDSEALSCIECAYLSDEHCVRIEREIRDTLKQVAIAVKDFKPMRDRAVGVREALLRDAGSVPVSRDELQESTDFIAWMVNNHFTFLGYEKYRIRKMPDSQGTMMELQEDSVLGVSRFKTEIKSKTRLEDLPEGTSELILRKQVCNFAKSSIRAKVHRPAYYDYILIKEFDKSGNVVTEHRFTGLYTSSVYFRPALDIPLVREKVRAVLDRSGFAPNGHSIKDLLQVINVFPRDELFQITTEQLYATALEITQIQDTRTCKLFVRKDSYGKFFSCLVYVPREIYTTRVRLRIQQYLKDRLQASELEYNIYLSESILARVHLVLRVPEIQNVKYDLVEMEQTLTELVKPWDDYFCEALQIACPDKDVDELYERYRNCFSTSYKEAYRAREAVADIGRIQRVLDSRDLALDLAPSNSESDAELRFKTFSFGQQLHLSDVDPILENLGLNIISEKTFRLELEQDCIVWLHDFSLYRKSRSLAYKEEIGEKFEEAFNAVWQGKIDDDAFNALVVNARLHWRDAALLRAYAAYLKQIQFGYGAPFIAETLSQHQDISRNLVRYFYALFDPDADRGRSRRSVTLRKQILAAIDEVVNLAEDSVFRAYLEMMDATLRTNFFQLNEEGASKDYFSFKFDPTMIDFIPKPRPRYEIFVYARGVEGVHLRGGKVARGGLRWSDRTEDYRTEVLGLVKAQQVKNAVIVPVGAKGGFVVKESMPEDREEQQQLGIVCYKTFISGLLDLTDNVSKGEVVHPARVVRLDEDDTYLVVAADKGTASFSDIANEIAAEYDFWLGDAFASGGSYGYDHKAMGITARGAWMSVQRHFRELGLNVQREEFTVVGIGDMSGDVFGNGMLLSKTIRLVASFNHRHIFIDPDPDAALSFKERERLFRKPRSSWSDYNGELISAGGGVFERSAKSIAISAKMKARFGIEKDRLTPNQLINQLLKSPVDLIWNGGIGTYVKSSGETHAEVGDKANDALRVDASELQCRVIGEGGNLGLTQKARIEFGLLGGISLTDFVDNSGGVDCSDHEVNIKILLNRLMLDGDLTRERRNSLLESMTETVAELVLDNNYSQVQTIGIAHTEVQERHKEYVDLIAFLEEVAGLKRKIENLPPEQELEERAARQQYLTRPEVAVLTSYMKMYLKSALVSVDFVDDPYLEPWLFSAFPKQLHKRHGDEIRAHPLRREIVATQLANALVNRLGPSYVFRMMDSTKSSVADVVRATVIALDAYAIGEYWSDVEALDYQVSSDIQTEMMVRLIRLVRRVTRWLLRNRRSPGGFAEEVDFFRSDIRRFKRMLPGKLPPDYGRMFEEKLGYLIEHEVPEALALDITRCDFLFPAPSFIEISHATGKNLSRVVETYYAVGEALQLNWLGKTINQLPASNYWQALARETYLDDLAWQQRALTSNIVANDELPGSAGKQVAHWVEQQADKLDRMQQILSQLQTESQPDYAMFSVTLRELFSLAEATAIRN